MPINRGQRIWPGAEVRVRDIAGVWHEAIAATGPRHEEIRLPDGREVNFPLVLVRFSSHGDPVAWPLADVGYVIEEGRPTSRVNPECTGRHTFTYLGFTGSSAPVCQKCGDPNPRYEPRKDPFNQSVRAG